MAKRSSRVRSDVRPNRKYVPVAFAAATTTAVSETFDTMMSAKEEMGWEIQRIDVTLHGAAGAVLAGVNVDCSLAFQVATGEQTALLDPDDAEVIGDLRLNFDSSAQSVAFPLSLPLEILVATRQISCVVDGSADATPLQSASSAVALFCIWYRWVPLDLRAYVDISEAKGVL